MGPISSSRVRSTGTGRIRTLICRPRAIWLLRCCCAPTVEPDWIFFEELMANTPQAKRIRRNSAHADQQESRVAHPHAREEGRKRGCRRRQGRRDCSARSGAARNGAALPCMSSTEHGCAQIFAPDQERERDRLIRARRTV